MNTEILAHEYRIALELTQDPQAAATLVLAGKLDAVNLADAIADAFRRNELTLAGTLTMNWPD